MERNDIKGILREEGNTVLKLIDHDFYNSVNQYIRELESELKKIKNPRSIEYKMLEDELQSVLDDVEVIFTRRIRKIVTHAVSNAFSNNPSSQTASKLISVEQKVFKSVLDAIQYSRDELLEPILDPSFKSSSIKKEDKTEKENIDDDFSITISNSECNQEEIKSIIKDEIVSKNDFNIKNICESDNISKNVINKECIVIRILKDIPIFKGIDNRNYSLSANDIISLPVPHAKGLVKKNVAQYILE